MPFENPEPGKYWVIVASNATKPLPFAVIGRPVDGVVGVHLRLIA
jgi:hypothetical protein